MNSDITSLLVLGLAVWRVSSLFVREKGPFYIFVRVRTWAGIQHDDNGLPWLVPDNFWAQLLGCVWCFSMWTGAVWTLAFLFVPKAILILSAPLALSAVAIALDSCIQKAK